MKPLRRIKRGYVLIKQSVSVMREHPRLGLFPVVGGAASVAFLALLLTPMFGVLAVDAGETATLVTVGGALLGLYLGTAFISAFFTAGLVPQTRAVLSGEAPSLRASLRGAWEVKGSLFVWAVLSATVGVVLDLVESSDSIVKTFGETPIGLIGVNIVATVAALPLLAPGTYLLFVAEISVAGVPLFVGGLLILPAVSL